MRRNLIILAVSVVALVAILPFSSEANPEYERAQEVLGRMAAATTELRDGSITADGVSAAFEGVEASTGTLADGTSGTVLVATHDERCFIVHWQSSAAAGPRAGTLDPGVECIAGQSLLDTLPTPPLVEAFPGTVPPLDAAQLQSPVGAPRHGTFDPFNAERTPGWFIAAGAVLFTIVIWQLVSITLFALRRRSPSRPVSPSSPALNAP